MYYPLQVQASLVRGQCTVITRFRAYGALWDEVVKVVEFCVVLLDVCEVAEVELALVVELTFVVVLVICEVVVMRVEVKVCVVLAAGRAALERVTPAKAEPIMIASITTVSFGAMVKRNPLSLLLTWWSANSIRRY